MSIEIPIIDIGFTTMQWRLVVAAINAASITIGDDIRRDIPSIASKEALEVCLDEYEDIQKTITSRINGDVD